MKQEILTHWIYYLKHAHFAKEASVDEHAELLLLLESWQKALCPSPQATFASYVSQITQTSSCHHRLGIGAQNLYLKLEDQALKLYEPSAEPVAPSPEWVVEYLERALSERNTLLIDLGSQSGQDQGANLCYMVPLFDQDRELGVMAIRPSWSGVPHEAMMELYRETAVHCSAWLADFVARDLMQKNHVADQAILDIAQDLCSDMSYQSLFRAVLKLASETLESERGTLFLYDRSSEELWSLYADGTDKEIRVPKNVGLVGHAFMSGQTLRINDVYRDQRFNQEVDKKTGFRTRNTLVVPIKVSEQFHSESQVGGVLQVLNKTHERDYSTDDQLRLERLVGIMSLALEKTNFMEMMNANDAVVVY